MLSNLRINLLTQKQSHKRGDDHDLVEGIRVQGGSHPRQNDLVSNSRRVILSNEKESRLREMGKTGDRGSRHQAFSLIESRSVSLLEMRGRKGAGVARNDIDNKLAVLRTICYSPPPRSLLITKEGKRRLHVGLANGPSPGSFLYEKCGLAGQKK